MVGVEENDCTCLPVAACSLVGGGVVRAVRTCIFKFTLSHSAGMFLKF